jgi:tetratricopeptide (TPR) repeat protein
LEAAQQDTKQSLEIARLARLENETVSALSSLGDIQMARGNLSVAYTSYDDGLKIALQAGDDGNAANCRLGLAKLALENGNASAAEKLSLQASGTFEKFGLVDSDGDALNTLARAFLAQDRFDEAQAQVDHAGKIGVQDQVVKLSLAVTAARLKAQTSNLQQAEQMLGSSLDEAKRMKLMALQLIIRLAEADIDQTPLSGRTKLNSVEADARKAGYGLIVAETKRRQDRFLK